MNTASIVGRRFLRRALPGVAWVWLAGIPCLAPAARAQTLYMRDGQVIPTQGLSREGDTVLASIQTKEGGQGKLGYPVANIARIDFPEPAQIKMAGDLLNAGKADEALRQITPILSYYGPFRDLPGNWWTPLALLQVDAFNKLGRYADLDAIVNDIARTGGTKPETLRMVKIKQAASIERRGEHQQALDLLMPIVKDTNAPPLSLTEAWLNIGTARLAQRAYKDALLAFLHVPVYTPDNALLMPPALLGCAGAYLGVDDRQRAQNALKELIAAYPQSPEAAQAKDRLQRLAAPPAKPAGS